ncbi:MAG: amidohydrolase [Planctomycetota bacterium]
MRTTLLAALLSVPLCAQDLVPKGIDDKRPVLIRGALIHTVTRGTILGGTLWFQKGIIRGVHGPGEDPSLPGDGDAREVDATNLHVYPGLIAAHSSLGLQEIGMVRQSVDLDEQGDLTPEALAAVAINPDSAAIPVTRSNGVLAAAVFPQGGLMPGRCSLIRLDGWTNGDLAIVRDAGLVVSWPSKRTPRRGPPAARGRDGLAESEGRDRIAETLASARAWAAARAADESVPTDIRYEAMMPSIRGEKPTFFLADDQEQIESAVRFAADEGLRAVIVGGRESLACSALLTRHDVPVVLDGTHRLPSHEDSSCREPFELPSMLQSAGVRFCLASGQPFYNERNLPYAAATAVAFGLDRQTAIEAMTIRAAEILGAGDRLGSLEAGKEATLFIADGSPLELTTRIRMAFVAGREIDLRNKQTALAEKYRARYRDSGRR